MTVKLFFNELNELVKNISGSDKAMHRMRVMLFNNQRIINDLESIFNVS